MVNQILDLVTLPPANYSAESDRDEYSRDEYSHDEFDREEPDCNEFDRDEFDQDDRQQSTVLIPASELHEGQQVLYNGTLLKVRRIVPAFTRPQACHIHLVPLDWQPLMGVGQQLADRSEATVLVRVACPTHKPFQVVA